MILNWVISSGLSWLITRKNRKSDDWPISLKIEVNNSFSWEILDFPKESKIIFKFENQLKKFQLFKPKFFFITKVSDHCSSKRGEHSALGKTRFLVFYSKFISNNPLEEHIFIEIFCRKSLLILESSGPRGWQPPSSYRHHIGDRYGLRQYIQIGMNTRMCTVYILSG